QPLALLVVSLASPTDARSSRLWRLVVDALAAAKRETDVVGWFQTNHAVGVILPEVPTSPTLADEVTDRVRRELARRLGTQGARRFSIRLQIHSGRRAVDVE